MDPKTRLLFHHAAPPHGTKALRLFWKAAGLAALLWAGHVLQLEDKMQGATPPLDTLCHVLLKQPLVTFDPAKTVGLPLGEYDARYRRVTDKLHYAFGGTVALSSGQTVAFETECTESAPAFVVFTGQTATGDSFRTRVVRQGVSEDPLWQNGRLKIVDGLSPAQPVPAELGTKAEVIVLAGKIMDAAQKKANQMEMEPLKAGEIVVALTSDTLGTVDTVQGAIDLGIPDIGPLQLRVSQQRKQDFERAGMLSCEGADKNHYVVDGRAYDWRGDYYAVQFAFWGGRLNRDDVILYGPHPTGQTVNYILDSMTRAVGTYAYLSPTPKNKAAVSKRVNAFVREMVRQLEAAQADGRPDRAGVRRPVLLSLQTGH